MARIACPYCGEAPLETVRKMLSVRGFLIGNQQTTRTLVGCTACVASELRKEAGRSLLYGWFSINAFGMNVFLIPYQFGRSFLVKPDPEAVRAFLAEARIPDDESELEIADAFYAFAAAMVKADGKIDAAEMAAAEEIGAHLLDGFDRDRFRAYVADAQFVVDTERLGRLLSDYLKNPDRTLLLRYLFAIAYADGNCSAEERALLERTAVALGLDVASLRGLEDEARQAFAAAG